MSLQSKANEEKIYKYLYKVLQNTYGVCGLMANIFAESGLNPRNLQNTCERRLGLTDDAYTKAVDDGSYKNFVTDSAGYGLCQWTYSSRKQNMLNWHKSRNKSIGDLETQLSFLMHELSTSYPKLIEILKNAKSVREASDAVLTMFEEPADQSNTVKQLRASYGEDYYMNLAKNLNCTKSGVSTPSRIVKPFKISSEFEVDDEVVVNGNIYSDGKGKGNCIKKIDSHMYVVGIVDSRTYPYCIGVANTRRGSRIGWCKPDCLSKVNSTSKNNKSMIAKDSAQSLNKSFVGTYEVTASDGLHIRQGAGSSKASMVLIPKGQAVISYGYYTNAENSIWLYVETTYKGVKYTGFCCKKYLKKS